METWVRTTRSRSGFAAPIRLSSWTSPSPAAAGARSGALAENSVGAYLVGSLATGDFDLDSDVDFLIVTDHELTDSEVRSLQALHVEIHALGSYPAQHLEGSYISKSMLARGDRVGVQPL